MNRLKDSIFYLCGNIDGIKDAGIGWRKDITPFLNNLGVKVINPCNKVPLKTSAVTTEGIDFRNKKNQLKKDGKYAELAELMRPVVRYDLRAVDKADALIVGLDMDSRPFGTIWEIVVACQQRKPVMICCKQGIKSISDWAFPLLNYNLFFDNFDDIKKYLLHINNDEIIDDLKGKWQIFDFS